MPLLSAAAWDDFLSAYPDAHILQTAVWGELKAAFGWEVSRLVAAQILFRPLPLGFTLAYIPKGPVGKNWEELWREVDALCLRKRAILLKVEPDLWELLPRSDEITPLPTFHSGSQTLQSAIHNLQSRCAPPPGFRLSPQTVQPPRTLVVDLSGNEEQILGRMKQKTRYNIRLALKKGVVVRPWADLPAFHRLMQTTGERDRFGVHSLEYYQRVYELFHPRGECELLLAEYEGEPLAALMVFAHGRRAWYFYGASSNEHRDRMPAYLLQWEAMRWARERGCIEYDLWGVPDADAETLEAHFTERSDGLWGVYRFKRGFGGQLRRSPGPWDRVYNPVLYAFYRWWTKREE